MTPHFLNWKTNPVEYAQLSDWVAHQIYGFKKDFGNGTAMAVLKGQELVAGMLYYDYDKDAGVIQISGAAVTPRWLTRPILWKMFSYPFNELSCQAVVMRVSPKDTRLKRILTSYGFDCHVIPRLRGRDQDEALYVLYDDVWRSNRYHLQNNEYDKV
jgi:hypothetical protein